MGCTGMAESIAGIGGARNLDGTSRLGVRQKLAGQGVGVALTGLEAGLVPAGQGGWEAPTGLVAKLGQAGQGV